MSNVDLHSVGCSHLEVLCISWCHLVTDDGIECLARRANKLRTFMCKGATQVSGYNCLVLYVIMAAQRSRCGHYIFALWFLSSSIIFIPRLISAVASWMSTIL